MSVVIRQQISSVLYKRNLSGIKYQLMKKKTDIGQKDKFIAAARELGCDMTQEEFAKTLKGIASVKPMTNAEVQKKAKAKKKKS